MNARPIEQALDADLRSSVRAMHRAAERARELAERTGTMIVVSRNGVVELLQPARSNQALAVHEMPASYREKP